MEKKIQEERTKSQETKLLDYGVSRTQTLSKIEQQQQ